MKEQPDIGTVLDIQYRLLIQHDLAEQIAERTGIPFEVVMYGAVAGDGDTTETLRLWKESWIQ